MGKSGKKRHMSDSHLFAKGADKRNRVSDDEQAFYYACEHGDTPTVQRFIDENRLQSYDKLDYMGRSPIRLAVQNEHLEIVEVLLDRCSMRNVYESLLQAISLGHDFIAEKIIRHPKYNLIDEEQKSGRLLDQRRKSVAMREIMWSDETSHFSSDITPIIMAAQTNQFNIVQLLLMRGDYIEPPHPYKCRCEECKIKYKDDQIKLATSRLNIYRALASEAYISLTSPDPILTAFELAHELQGVAKEEKYYRSQYESLAESLTEYTVKLLERVRTNDELMIILNKTTDPNHEFESLARLQLAIEYEQKKFVAHPSCQQKLINIWYMGSRTFETADWFFRLLMVAFFVVFYPFFVIAYLFLPESKVARMMSYPFIKFLAHTTTYITFIGLIVGASFVISGIHCEGRIGLNRTSTFANESIACNQTISTISTIPEGVKFYLELETNDAAHDGHKTHNFRWPADGSPLLVRPHSPGALDLLMFLWLLGFIFQECKEVYREGLEAYAGSAYNLIDFGMMSCYMGSFILRWLSLIKVQRAIDYFELPDSWGTLSPVETDETLAFRDANHIDPSLDYATLHQNAQYKFYWLIADRYYWNVYDPMYASDALFAVANVFTLSRISYLLPANELFGPMHISLGKMIKDIFIFLTIFMMFFVAFWIGLYNLFNYYDDANRERIELNKDHYKIKSFKAAESFGNIEQAFRTIFWSVFGMAERDSPDMEGFGLETPTVIQNVGYILFGAWHIATIIVLLNMLIATMSRSFELITEDADIEWKFARTRLYMNYIPKGSTLPAPYNLLPEPFAIWRLLKNTYLSIKERRCRCGSKTRPIHVDTRSVLIKNIFGMPIFKKDVVCVGDVCEIRTKPAMPNNIALELQRRQNKNIDIEQPPDTEAGIEGGHYNNTGGDPPEMERRRSTLEEDITFDRVDDYTYQVSYRM